MSDSDVEGVEFVAMLRTTLIYITGNVVSDHKHFPTVKVPLLLYITDMPCSVNPLSHPPDTITFLVARY